VVVERVRANGRWRDAREGEPMALEVDARDLDFEFTALSFQAPANVDLRVRLRGYDADWRALDDPTRRDARYTNLPPGDYVFEVTGANNDGVWAVEPGRLAFSIAPAFHETWAARGLLALVAALVLYALHRLKLHRLRRQSEALELLVSQRTEALEDANRRLSEASLTDPLTGLRNRRYIGAQIPADLAFYDREPELGPEGGGVLVLAIIDIDHFKRVNDTHGHHAGDLVLQQFARVLEQQVRTGDYIARWGGEEFVLVFRPLPGRHVPMLGERLRSAIANHPFDIGGAEPLRITCSIGFVAYPLFDRLRGLPGWELMLSLADRALYHAKANGRDGWAQYVARHGIDGEAASAALAADPTLRPEDAGLVLIGPRAVPRPDPGAQNA
jgi:diguanylate cyclase (GGDEF)-like protein